MSQNVRRNEWLQKLGLSPEQSPRALWLRATRNLHAQTTEHRKLLESPTDLIVPNGLFENLTWGRLAGEPVLYALIYGAAMACEVSHLGAMLGARLLLLTGCCGSLKADQLHPGELLVATEATGCTDVSKLYPCPEKLRARVYGRDLTELAGGKLHFGGVRSVAGFMGATPALLAEWAREGVCGIDLETAAVYAVGQHFGLDRVAFLYAFDTPLGDHAITAPSPDLRKLRADGNATVTALARQILTEYLQAPRPSR